MQGLDDGRDTPIANIRDLIAPFVVGGFVLVNVKGFDVVVPEPLTPLAANLVNVPDQVPQKADHVLENFARDSLNEHCR